jgi:hypothetical protein
MKISIEEKKMLALYLGLSSDMRLELWRTSPVSLEYFILSVNLSNNDFKNMASATRKRYKRFRYSDSKFINGKPRYKLRFTREDIDQIKRGIRLDDLVN